MTRRRMTSREVLIPLWHILLIAFALAWGVQALGVWRQTRHFQRVFDEQRLRWSDGKLGAGVARASLGKGVIALVVVDSANVVRTVLVMRGRSVFATFKPRSEFEGLSLESLKARVCEGAFQRTVGKAISNAIEQIEKIGRSSVGTTGAVPTPA